MLVNSNYDILMEKNGTDSAAVTIIAEENETIADVVRRASRISVLTTTKVEYLIKGKHYFISPRQARALFTPEDVFSQINKLESDISLAKSYFEKYMSYLFQSLEEEKLLAEKLYPKSDSGDN